MRLSEQLKVIATTDRIRIIQGKRGNREPQFGTGSGGRPNGRTYGSPSQGIQGTRVISAV